MESSVRLAVRASVTQMMNSFCINRQSKTVSRRPVAGTIARDQNVNFSCHRRRRKSQCSWTRQRFSAKCSPKSMRTGLWTSCSCQWTQFTASYSRWSASIVTHHSSTYFCMIFRRIFCAIHSSIQRPSTAVIAATTAACRREAGGEVGQESAHP